MFKYESTIQAGLSNNLETGSEQFTPLWAARAGLLDVRRSFGLLLSMSLRRSQACSQVRWEVLPLTLLALLDLMISVPAGVTVNCRQGAPEGLEDRRLESRQKFTPRSGKFSPVPSRLGRKQRLPCHKCATFTKDGSAVVAALPHCDTDTQPHCVTNFEVERTAKSRGSYNVNYR
ncbi:hypothetical protein J6590_079542 [Homalodisca vitripennis]|nr:hypothetical protein J6590_079542 [Homalodisca vitripennis]